MFILLRSPGPFFFKSSIVSLTSASSSVFQPAIWQVLQVPTLSGRAQRCHTAASELSAERGKARAGNLRHSFVAWVGNNMEQFGDSFASDRGDNAELGKVSSDRINYRGLLADEQMAGAVKDQVALLLRCLCWHEAHVGSGDRFANSLSVSHVVLLPFDVGLHVSRRH